MKKKFLVIILCFFILVPSVIAETSNNNSEVVENSTSEATENTTEQSSTAEQSSTVGQIKAITCTGNPQDQIPETLPMFVRGLFNILKFLIPIIIIVLGILDFFKAMTSGNESDMDEKKSKFIRRLIGGIALFFVFAIVQWVFGLVGSKNNFMGCVSCFLSDKEDCADAGYIDPSVNDRQNKTPTITPPKSTNTVVVGGTDSYDSVDVDKILKEAKWVTDYVRKHNFTYGNAPINPAINHDARIVSCDRCVGWVLYRLGYKDQPKSNGLVVWSPGTENDLTAYCKKHNFKRINNISDIKPGDIIFQRAGSTGSTVSHVFILGNKKSNGNWERYDCGTPERILSKQPLVMDFPKERFLYAYRITSSKSSSSSTSSSKGKKTILLGDSRTAGICNVGDGYYSGKCRDYQAVCQTGKGYSWFKSTGAAGVTKILKNNSGTKYNIVILLGVNDISGSTSYVDSVANQYMSIIKSQAKGDWKNHNIIFASVTPIGAASTNDRYPVTQNNIKHFNSTMKSKISAAKLSNVSYCDINTGLSLSGKYASDLLHYTSAGYTAVYNQIKKKCL